MIGFQNAINEDVYKVPQEVSNKHKWISMSLLEININKCEHIVACIKITLVNRYLQQLKFGIIWN